MKPHKNFKCCFLAILAYFALTVFIGILCIMRNVSSEFQFFEIDTFHSFCILGIIIITPFLYVISFSVIPQLFILLSSIVPPNAILICMIFSKYKYIYFIVTPYILFYSLNSYTKLSLNFNLASFMLKKSTIIIIKNVSAIYLTYLIFSTFAYLYFKTIITILFNYNFEQNNYFYELFLLISLFLHSRWTYYLLIDSSCFILTTTLAHYIIQKTENQKLRNYFESLKNFFHIFPCLFFYCNNSKFHKKRVQIVNPQNHEANETVKLVLFIMFCFFTSIYENRKGWRLVKSLFFKKCPRYKIDNTNYIFYNYKQTNLILYYILNFRFLLPTITFAIIFSINKYEKVMDFFPLSLVIAVALFCNAIMCYIYDNTWRLLVLFICVFGDEKMENYDLELCKNLKFFVF